MESKNQTNTPANAPEKITWWEGLTLAATLAMLMLAVLAFIF